MKFLSIVHSRRLLLATFSILVSAVSTGCTSLRLALANLPAAFGSYEVQRGVKYGSLTRQALDVYRPSKRDTSQPVVIFVHGGEWTGGTKDQYRFVAEALTSRGFVAVLPNYRLYPEGVFPAFVDDVAQAVAWVHSHAAEFGGDPQRVFLSGHSAGAQIGALIAFDPGYLRTVGGERSWLAGFIGLAGPYDFLPFKEAYLHDVFGAEAQYPKTQPVNFVDAAATPTLLVHGEVDTVVSPNNSRSLAKRLRQSGVRVFERYYEHMDHGDVLAALSVYYRGRRSVLDEIDAFVRAGDAENSTRQAVATTRR